MGLGHLYWIGLYLVTTLLHVSYGVMRIRQKYTGESE